MPKYNGRFVVKDIANGVQYLADLLYQFELGDSLAGWTLGGGTNPTISSDGRIDLYDASAGVNGSYLVSSIINGAGELLIVAHFKATRMPDDTSTGNNSLISGPTSSISLTSGPWFNCTGVNINGTWNNFSGTGISRLLIAGPMTIGREYTVDIVMDNSKILFIVDNIYQGMIFRGERGTVALSATPIQAWLAGSKRIGFWAGHAAGQISHIQVRDIKVGRLAGIGSV